MAAADIFVCGTGDAARALEFVVRELAPAGSKSVSVGRGRRA